MKEQDSYTFVWNLLFRWPPSSGGDLDWEVGRGEEGEDLGGDVVAAVVHALAE